ncbi:hypothetical protein PtA15_13A1, partial [Puccinia triticina]
DHKLGLPAGMVRIGAGGEGHPDAGGARPMGLAGRGLAPPESWASEFTTFAAVLGTW